MREWGPKDESFPRQKQKHRVKMRENWGCTDAEVSSAIPREVFICKMRVAPLANCAKTSLG